MTKSQDNFWAMVNGGSRAVSYSFFIVGILGAVGASVKLLMDCIEKGSSQLSGWDMGESIIAIVWCGSFLIIGFLGIRAKPYVPPDKRAPPLK